MTSEELARSYLRKATDRLEILDLLLSKEAYSDVIREGQEIVELALKGMLRAVGVEPPKWHDVGPILQEQRGHLPDSVRGEVDELARISAWLRDEREASFYGEDDPDSNRGLRA
jgi:HEPN domain-containing protein